MVQLQLLGRKHRFTGLVPDSPEPHVASGGHSLAPREAFPEEPGGGAASVEQPGRVRVPSPAFACVSCLFCAPPPPHSPQLWMEDQLFPSRGSGGSR